MRELAKTAVAILRAARGRISDPKRWCQRRFRLRDNDGVIVAWCAFGAVAEELKANGGDYFRTLLCDAANRSITSLNDAKPAAKAHRNVIAAYDAAIAKLCRTWAIPLLLLALALPVSAQTAYDAAQQDITLRRAQYLTERANLEKSLAETAAQIEQKNRELHDLEVEAKTWERARKVEKR